MIPSGNNLVRGHRPIATIAACLALAALGLSWIIRLHLGVDFSDESWYLATIYRFVRGDRPYVDEIFLMQGFALFPVPIFSLLGFDRSPDGIVLAGRYIYALFNLAVGYAVARACRIHFSRAGQLLIVMTWISFIPYGLPNLSYNTLALGFIGLGFAALMERTVYGGGNLCIPLYGALMAAASVAHPSMLPVSVWSAGIVLLLESKSRLKSLFFYLCGFVLVVVSTGLLYKLSPSTLWANYLLTVQMNTEFENRPDIKKALAVVWEFLTQRGILVAIAVALMASPRLYRYRPWTLGALLIFSAPICFLLTRTSIGGLGAHGLNLYFGLLAPAVILFLGDKKKSIQFLVGGWSMAVVAAFCTSLTSYNGLASGGIPAILATVVVFLLLGQWVAEQQPWKKKWVHLTPVLCVLLSHSYLNFRNIYHEDKLSLLTERIDKGAFRGLYTSLTKKKLLDEYSAFLAPYQTATGRILFYPTFPAGYLLTRRQPLLPTTWGCMGLPDNVCLDYVRSHSTPNDVWIRVNRFYYMADQISVQGLDHFLDVETSIELDITRTMQAAMPTKLRVP